MSCITTYTGLSVNPLKTTEDDLRISDIAHALSLLCRANGHLPHFYSVAQHSINCANEAKARGYSVRVQLGCLLHDGSEAYLSDITRPVKPLLPDYLEIEKNIQGTVYGKWISPELTCDELEKIRSVDNAILHYEFLNMMNTVLGNTPELKSEPRFDFVDFTDVENEFLRKFKFLTDDGISIGVDWMKKKWLAAELCGDVATLKSFDDVESLCLYYSDADKILIDVPIGLSSSPKESFMRPDGAARNFLKVAARKSSVFNTPTREMVYADSASSAWEIKLKTGAKISKQGLGILPCIRQVDVFLQAHPIWKTRLIESHPECAFQALNDGNGLAFSKHKEPGIALRCRILEKYVSNVYDLIETVGKKEHKDVLDALCLAATAKLGFKPINEQVFFDKFNIPMQIVVAK